MSIIDKAIAAVTPPESDEARAKARARARAAANENDWVAMLLNHHEQVEAAFAAVRAASDSASRAASFKKLSTLLTGHSLAEEAALYPAVSDADESANAIKAYTAQSAAQLKLGGLEDLPPMGQEFLGKLGHLEGAVAHHIYDEQHNWFWI
jgi:hypothetical protein